MEGFVIVASLLCRILSAPSKSPAVVAALGRRPSAAALPRSPPSLLSAQQLSPKCETHLENFREAEERERKGRGRRKETGMGSHIAKGAFRAKKKEERQSRD